MSHFLYNLTLPTGKLKSGQVTGKTEADARERLKSLYAFVSLQSIRPKPVASTTPKVASSKPAAPPIPKVTPPAKLSAVATKPLTSVKASLPPKPIAAKTVTPAKPLSEKKKSKLQKLLFQQDGNCFFCGKLLAKEDASIEHLQPKSGGGNDADGNVVACCIALNRTLGDMNLKAKVAMILKKSGHFTCPAD